MPQNMFLMAQRQHDRLIKELESESRLPEWLIHKTEATCDNYKFIIHALLEEITELRKDNW